MAIPTGRDSDKFVIRLPAGMRDRIKVAADSNGRSMNGEIVEALEKAFPKPRSASDLAQEIAISLGFAEPALRKQAFEILVKLSEQGRLDAFAEASAEPYKHRD